MWSKLKYVVAAFSALSAVLALSASILAAGGQGIFVLVLCAIPGALAAAGHFVWHGFPRRAAVGSLVSFLLVGLKTSGGDASLQNVMVVAFFGMIVALALTIKPDKPPTT
jgi:hypothetical protein